MHPINPIFRWAGSKRKQLAHLETYWKQSFRRYVEPFAGSAALFFRIQPNRAVLGDINGELIQAYEVIAKNPDDIHSTVSAIPRTESSYYEMRASRPRSEFGRAVRFVFLNRLCFNGIYRTNAKGEFNVPFGKVKPGAIPPVEDFRKCANVLSRATLRCTDFGSILSQVRSGDFVYLDPPYVVDSRRIFCEYHERTFSPKDLKRLGQHLDGIHRKGAGFVATYADCKEARILFKPWKVRRLQVRRHIAGFASARRTAVEIVATNISEGSVC